MASVASLQFGQQLIAGLAQVAAVAPPGAIISPLSVWFALVLLFNGAGECFLIIMEHLHSACPSLLFSEPAEVLAGHTEAVSLAQYNQDVCLHDQLRQPQADRFMLDWF
jgi:hypothetical protein